MEPAFDLDTEIATGKALLLSMPEVEKFALIGSASFMPADQVADVDFAVLLKPGTSLRDFDIALITQGWQQCGEYDTSDAFEWTATRRGHLNLMLSTSTKFYEGYLLAMRVIRLLNVTDKSNRIAVCKVVRDGVDEVTAAWMCCCEELVVRE